LANVFVRERADLAAEFRRLNEPLKGVSPIVRTFGEDAVAAVVDGPDEIAARAGHCRSAEQACFEVLHAALALRVRVIPLQWSKTDVNAGEEVGERLPWLDWSALDARAEPIESSVEVQFADGEKLAAWIRMEDAKDGVGGFQEIPVVRPRAAEIRDAYIIAGAA